jgi:hypothetical protein
MKSKCNGQVKMNTVKEGKKSSIENDFQNTRAPSGGAHFLIANAGRLPYYYYYDIIGCFLKTTDTRTQALCRFQGL